MEAFSSEVITSFIPAQNNSAARFSTGTLFDLVVIIELLARTCEFFFTVQRHWI
jgi:hypothetical protein